MSQQRTKHRRFEGFYALPEFMELIGVSYTCYARLRALGKMPKEIRLSQRTILISQQAIDEWRQQQTEGAA